jgi:hypothetical protein
MTLQIHLLCNTNVVTNKYETCSSLVATNCYTDTVVFVACFYQFIVSKHNGMSFMRTITDEYINA